MLDPRGLAARAAEVAARQRSPETRRTYAAVYRAFAAFLGPQAPAEDLTPEAVRAYRDHLKQVGRSPRCAGSPTRSAPTRPCGPSVRRGWRAGSRVP